MGLLHNLLRKRVEGESDLGFLPRLAGEHLTGENAGTGRVGRLR